MRSSRRLWCLAGLLTAFLASGAGAAPITLIPSENPAAVLHNPDMGWVVYENYPLDQGQGSTLVTCPKADWSAVDHVALMFSWEDVEKAPDVYDFSKVDYAYDWWRHKVKSIMLRMSTDSLLWWTGAGTGRGVPPYVLDRLPADQKQVRTSERIPYTVVDATNPYYLERLRRFLTTVARHYAPDGGRPVSLVDLRGFGLWGEWHTGYQYPSLEVRHRALRGIIDAWSAAFPENWLALSFSYDPDSPEPLRSGPTDHFDPAFTGAYQEFLHFSGFDHALTRPNITWRRDGAGGAVHSNERKLCEAAYRARGGPMMSEFVGGYPDAKRAGDKHVRFMVEDALSLHPNYVNLLSWQCQDAHNFLTGEPELIAHGLRTMGYRLVPTRVICPRAFVAGRPASVTITWVNRGVGRALRDFRLRLRLTDSRGNVVANADAGRVRTSRLLKDETRATSAEVTFGRVPRAGGRLLAALVDPASGKPIALPLRGKTPDGFYPLGDLP